MEEDKDNQMASEDKEEDIFHHTFFCTKKSPKSPFKNGTFHR